MVTENQSRSVNGVMIHSSIFSRTSWAIAGILLWNDYDVTRAIKILKNIDFSDHEKFNLRRGKHCPEKATNSIICSQTSCAVLSHCFTNRTWARESTFFV